MDSEALAEKIIRENIRKIMAIGASDTGKTTLLLRLASYLVDRGRKVGVIDCDLGQSTVGPPMTVGLMLPWRSDDQAETVLFPTKMIFVGETTPAYAVSRVVEASLKLDGYARERGYHHLLIDTSGMVKGHLAALLKRSKMRKLLPDLIVALERSGELGHILGALEEGLRRNVITMEPPPLIRKRERAERVRYRALLWRRYFRDARPRALDVSAMRIEPHFPVKNWLGEPGLERGQLLGLADCEGFTLGIGKLLHQRGSNISVLTPYTGSLDDIDYISVSGHLLGGEGDTIPIKFSGVDSVAIKGIIEDGS